MLWKGLEGKNENFINRFNFICDKELLVLEKLPLLIKIFRFKIKYINIFPCLRSDIHFYLCEKIKILHVKRDK